jgi:hypothetical protein
MLHLLTLANLKCSHTGCYDGQYKQVSYECTYDVVTFWYSESYPICLRLVRWVLMYFSHVFLDIPLGLHAPTHLIIFHLITIVVGTKEGFIICFIPPLLKVAIDILSSKTYASHFLWFDDMLKSGLESSGLRFIHDLRCSVHALHDWLIVCYNFCVSDTRFGFLATAVKQERPSPRHGKRLYT